MSAVSSSSDIQDIFPSIYHTDEAENALRNVKGSNKNPFSQKIINLCLEYFTSITILSPNQLIDYFKNRNTFEIQANTELRINNLNFPIFLTRAYFDFLKPIIKFYKVLDLILALIGKKSCEIAPGNEKQDVVTYSMTSTSCSIHSTFTTALWGIKDTITIHPSSLLQLMIFYDISTFKLKVNQSIDFYVNNSLSKMDPKHLNQVLLQLVKYIPQGWHYDRVTIPKRFKGGFGDIRWGNKHFKIFTIHIKPGNVFEFSIKQHEQNDQTREIFHGENLKNLLRQIFDFRGT